MAARFGRNTANLSQQVALADEAGSAATKRRRLQQDLAEAANIQSPYGSLVQVLTIGALRLPFISPWVFLYAATQESMYYGHFLDRTLGNNDTLHVLLYAFTECCKHTEAACMYNVCLDS